MKHFRWNPWLRDARARDILFEGNRYEAISTETFTLEPVASGCPGKGYYASFFLFLF
jgi:hypothetical protein